MGSIRKYKEYTSECKRIRNELPKLPGSVNIDSDDELEPEADELI